MDENRTQSYSSKMGEFIMKYEIAINLRDALILNREERKFLNLTDQTLEQDVIMGESPNEDMIKFRCGILQAACICDVIKLYLLYHQKSLMGVYIKKENKDNWHMIDITQYLTYMDDSTYDIKLNPDIFVKG